MGPEWLSKVKCRSKVKWVSLLLPKWTRTKKKHVTSIQKALTSVGFMNRSLVAGIVDEVFSVEQEIEVLRRLGQEERLHPVFQRVVANILDQ